MSNTLEKLFIVSRTLIPGYTTQTWVPGTTSTTYSFWGYNSNGSIVYLQAGEGNQHSSQPFSFSYLGPNGWETVIVLGETPDVTTTTTGYFTSIVQPDVYTYSYAPNLGWNSSARSISTILGNGTASFTAKLDMTGGVVGFNELYDSLGSDYFEISFAIYLSNGFYKVAEQGNFKGSSLPYIASDVFSISRHNSSIYYAKNNVVFYKSLSTSNEELLLDVSLYAGGDAVYDASITNSSIIDLGSANL